ncbi:hypothetical protein AB4303_23215, partial [Vibrio sp. 10N.261.52.E6]
MPLTFAHFLEQARKERGLTQQEMLELLLEADPTLSKLDLRARLRSPLPCKDLRKVSVIAVRFF